MLYATLGLTMLLVHSKICQFIEFLFQPVYGIQYFPSLHPGIGMVKFPDDTATEMFFPKNC
jgi:hypothetical protein